MHLYMLHCLTYFLPFIYASQLKLCLNNPYIRRLFFLLICYFHHSLFYLLLGRKHNDSSQQTIHLRDYQTWLSQRIWVWLLIYQNTTCVMAQKDPGNLPTTIVPKFQQSFCSDFFHKRHFHMMQNLQTPRITLRFVVANSMEKILGGFKTIEQSLCL